MDEIAHCQATRRDGTPCQQPARESGYCWAHDPAYDAARDKGRANGGKNKANIRRLEKAIPPKLQGVFTVLQAALAGVYKGSLAPQRGQALAAIARAMVAVLTAGELEERVRKLEEVKQVDKCGA